MDSPSRRQFLATTSAGLTGILAAGVAPASKLMYGSDVSALPELFALSADWARATLGEALGWLVERDGLDDVAAKAAGQSILCDNARVLYGLT